MVIFSSGTWVIGELAKQTSNYKKCSMEIHIYTYVCMYVFFSMVASCMHLLITLTAQRIAHLMRALRT